MNFSATISDLRRAPLGEGQGGAALVEMTAVLPFLVAIGLGALEFGNFFYQYHLMSNAVRDAARYASGRTDDVCSSANTVARDAITGIAERTGAGQIWPKDLKQAKITITCSAGIDNSNQFYRGPSNLRSVIVTGEAPYASLGFLEFFQISIPKIKASHEERIIGSR